MQQITIAESHYANFVKVFKILQKQLTEMMTVLNEVKEQQRSLTMQITQLVEDISITPTENTNQN